MSAILHKYCRGKTHHYTFQGALPHYSCKQTWFVVTPSTSPYTYPGIQHCCCPVCLFLKFLISFLFVIQCHPRIFFHTMIPRQDMQIFIIFSAVGREGKTFESRMQKIWFADWSAICVTHQLHVWSYLLEVGQGQKEGIPEWHCMRQLLLQRWWQGRPFLGNVNLPFFHRQVHDKLEKGKYHQSRKIQISIF